MVTLPNDRDILLLAGQLPTKPTCPVRTFLNKENDVPFLIEMRLTHDNQHPNIQTGGF